MFHMESKLQMTTSRIKINGMHFVSIEIDQFFMNCGKKIWFPKHPTCSLLVGVASSYSVKLYHIHTAARRTATPIHPNLSGCFLSYIFRSSSDIKPLLSFVLNLKVRKREDGLGVNSLFFQLFQDQVEFHKKYFKKQRKNKSTYVCKIFQ